MAAEVDNAPAGRREHAGVSALLLAAFALVCVMPVVPGTWHAPMAAAGVLLLVITAATRDHEAVALSLFCAILLAGVLVNPWRGWPMGLLLPLLVYVLLVGMIPSLRRAVGTPSWGRLDRVTVAFSVVTVVGSSAALVLWYRLARPDIADVRAMVPSLPGWMMPLAGLGFAVVNAVMEETIWRGILWRLLSRAVPSVWVVIAAQAASFGLIHIHGFPRGWAGVGMAALYGLFLGLIRHRAGGLGPPIVAHVFADVTIFAILVLTMAR